MVARNSGSRSTRDRGFSIVGSTSSGSLGTVGREEVRAVAALLAVAVLLGVLGRAVALGASSDALVGVVGLAVAGAGNLVTLGDAANVLGVT